MFEAVFNSIICMEFYQLRTIRDVITLAIVLTRWNKYKKLGVCTGNDWLSLHRILVSMLFYMLNMENILTHKTTNHSHNNWKYAMYILEDKLVTPSMCAYLCWLVMCVILIIRTYLMLDKYTWIYRILHISHLSV